MNTISRTQFAKILGITTNAVKQWELSRTFGECYESDSKINIEKALKWLYLWKVEVEESFEQSEDPKSIKTYWDAKKSEATYKQLIEEYIPKTEYLQTEKERLIILVQLVMTLPEKLAPELGLNEDQKRNVHQSCLGIINHIKSTYKGKSKEWIDIVNSPMLKEDDENAK